MPHTVALKVIPGIKGRHIGVNLHCEHVGLLIEEVCVAVSVLPVRPAERALVLDVVACAADRAYLQGAVSAENGCARRGTVLNSNFGYDRLVRECFVLFLVLKSPKEIQTS
jgi:hypothetical protein